MMEFVDYKRMKEWVGFGPRDAALLGRLKPAIIPHIGPVVHNFYRRLMDDPQARTAFTAQQLERQRMVLAKWIEELFGGVYEQAYFQQRCEIGRAHVRANLPQRFMFTGMNIIRCEMEDHVRVLNPPEVERCVQALHKLLDLELAVMLETYRERSIARIRESDRRAMQRRLDEVQHMASFGQLAASLAHEIKNPLAGISGAIQIISQEINPEHPHAEIMNEILRQIDRLDSAVKDLLVFARPKSPELSECDLGETIHNCLTVLSEDPQIKSLQIQYDGLDSGIRTLLDKSQFEQVITNLMLNAAQACNGDGAVRISVRQENDGIAVILADNGPGMTRDVIRQATEPFFTTKARGTGLGLPICKRIIEAHHGELRIRSRPAMGTRVTLRLPGMAFYDKSRDRTT